MSKKGYLDGARDGDDLQHAARQRPDLVVRGEQLPAGQGPLPVRPAVLERRRHAHAGAMHSYYLRNMYQKNLLVQPGGIELDGVPIDLRKIDDRRSTCRPARKTTSRRARRSSRRRSIFSGPVRFMLAGSGHIAGVVNPPRRQEVPALDERDGEEPADARGVARRRRPSIPARGGTTGTSGCRRSPARRCRRACRATAACRRSRTRRAAT